MNIFYICLLISIIVGTYTYYDTKSYSSKESKMTHVFINMSLTVIFVWFIFILIEVVNNIF